jgi:transposase
MSKVSAVASKRLFCGIDVSAATLAVAVQQEGSEGFEQHEFANTCAGHKKLLAWLGRQGRTVRVSLEATGIYSQDVAVALDGAEGIEVAVLNPLVAQQFCQTMRRSKTDAADALALAEYSRRMPFVAWRRPPLAALRLRSISRHIATLRDDHSRLRSRLHAARASATTPVCVGQDLKNSMMRVQKSRLKLVREAMAVIAQDAELQRKFQLLQRIKGIAETSAVQLLGELAGMDPSMSVRQWVAHSGLDPQHRSSGTSVHPPSRISRRGNRHLRLALYMPALVASRFDPHMKAFYGQLKARHKASLQALVALQRKMLHAIYGSFKSNTPYNGAKLFPHISIVANTTP